MNKFDLVFPQRRWFSVELLVTKAGCGHTRTHLIADNKPLHPFFNSPTHHTTRDPYKSPTLPTQQNTAGPNHLENRKQT